MEIYCCGCGVKVDASLTNGGEIYPHRKDLHDLPFWKCDKCGNYVGCHYKTKTRTRPLGHIPTPELRNARKKIHGILDPLWRGDNRKRKELYSIISEKIGWKYHSAKLRNIKEAREIYRVIKTLTTNH